MTTRGDEVIIQSLASNKQSKRAHNTGSSKQVNKENNYPMRAGKNSGSTAKKTRERALLGSTVSAKDLLLGSSSRARKSNKKNRNDSKSSVREFGQTLIGFNPNVAKADSLNCSKRS